MRILVCNDDGVFSPLIKRLALCLKKYGEVLVCAPNRERSASSQAIDFINHHKEDIKLEFVEQGVRFYSHPSYPTDSLLYVLDFMDYKPDLVVSGVNIGFNLGEDVYYSGTVGIATAAAQKGIRCFALSMDREYKKNDLDSIDHVVDYIMQNKYYSNQYILNINIPLNIKEFKYRFTALAGKNNDVDACKNVYISLTPLVVDRTDYSVLNKISK